MYKSQNERYLKSNFVKRSNHLLNINLLVSSILHLIINCFGSAFAKAELLLRIYPTFIITI
ncbi:hypothetical protein DDD_0222 [Nonlabens dokdonensis DSW-6]|uniref:Uncharacterized protein n=1 Tax=Nonlabens dokdonensis (strain DSM 17205 / KCTC 12402 / DSW-6) TaxID=592029 RepID=L7W5J4_NONDD|nr:hypothetical protein DDD_0222 [Nonlabens dokdonensis DSW-6]